MTVTRTYPDRTCERCRSRYTPTGANQKVCAKCRTFRPRRPMPARPAEPVQTVRPIGRPYIPYEIPLGDRDRVRLVLPADLTQAEADRICGVIQTLPFPDPPAEQE